jgi:hypothetical protein
MTRTPHNITAGGWSTTSIKSACQIGTGDRPATPRLVSLAKIAIAGRWFVGQGGPLLAGTALA